MCQTIPVMMLALKTRILSTTSCLFARTKQAKITPRVRSYIVAIIHNKYITYRRLQKSGVSSPSPQAN